MNRRLILGAMVFALALPLSAETWKSVSLMDAGCANKKDVMAAPQKHTKSCAMQCAKAGYGAVVNGKFVKFDAKGSDMAAAAIKNSSKKDNLRADVTGEIKGDTLTVTSLKME